MLLLRRSCCYFAAVKTSVCPHCHTPVPNQANVCTGCSAEVVRGATRKERSAVGGLFGFVALLVGLFLIGSSRLPSANSEGALFVILGLAALVVLGYAFGTVVARVVRSSQPRFFRSYEHQ